MRMNLDRWQHLRDGKTPPDSMDWRHVRMLHAMLVGECPRSVVEIGCARGFSTAAILEAVEGSGAIKTVDLIEPHLNADLVNAVLSIRPDHVFARFRIHVSPSSEYHGAPECWIIDGDHNAGALIDYDRARAANARIVAVHDSNSAHVIGNHRGSMHIAERVRHEAICCFEDKAKRAGEFTERGLVIGFFYQPKAATIEQLNQLTK